MKKIRCFSVRSDHDGYEVSNMKDVLAEFGLHVDLGEIEAQSARHDPICQVVVSDAPLTPKELAEIREFWPPNSDWSKPDPNSPNKDNDVK